MMRWRLKSLIAEYEETRKQSLTYRDIEQETGLSKTTLTHMATNKSARADLATIDSLLLYFGKKLDRTLNTADLLHHDPTDCQSSQTTP